VSYPYTDRCVHRTIPEHAIEDPAAGARRYHLACTVCDCTYELVQVSSEPGRCVCLRCDHAPLRVTDVTEP
jgi:hypothetical protein